MVSSNRYFVKKVDVSTLSDGFYRERERLALYLLNDSIEIAKWRNRSHGTSLLKVSIFKMNIKVSYSWLASISNKSNHRDPKLHYPYLGIDRI